MFSTSSEHIGPDIFSWLEFCNCGRAFIPTRNNAISLKGGLRTSDPKANVKFNVGVDEIFLLASLFNLGSSAIWAFLLGNEAVEARQRCPLWLQHVAITLILMPMHFSAPVCSNVTILLALPEEKHNVHTVGPESKLGYRHWEQQAGIKVQNMTATRSLPGETWFGGVRSLPGETWFFQAMMQTLQNSRASSPFLYLTAP